MRGVVPCGLRLAVKGDPVCTPTVATILAGRVGKRPIGR